VETIRLAPYQQEELAEMVSELPTPSGSDDTECGAVQKKQRESELISCFQKHNLHSLRLIVS
jgi:hypothetical protein